jgi:periplasmic divalent cation tolerance protein
VHDWWLRSRCRGSRPIGIEPLWATPAELVDRLIARIRQLHSYECRCVVALSVAAGNPDYLDWIARQTAPA